MKARRIAVFVVLAITVLAESASAGPFNFVFRRLGLGWSDGYHATSRSSVPAPPYAVDRPKLPPRSLAPSGGSLLAPEEIPAPQRNSQQNPQRMPQQKTEQDRSQEMKQTFRLFRQSR